MSREYLITYVRQHLTNNALSISSGEVDNVGNIWTWHSMTHCCTVIR